MTPLSSWQGCDACKCCISDDPLLGFAGFSLFCDDDEFENGAGGVGCWNSDVVDSDDEAVFAEAAVDVVLPLEHDDVAVVTVGVAAAGVSLEDTEFSTRSDEEECEEGSDKLADVLLGLPRIDFFVSGSAGRFGEEKANAFRLLFRLPKIGVSGKLFLALAGLAVDGAAARDNFSSVSESDWKSYNENLASRSLLGAAGNFPGTLFSSKPFRELSPTGSLGCSVLTVPASSSSSSLTCCCGRTMAMAFRFVPFDSFLVDKMRGLEPTLSSELDTDPEDDDGALLKKIYPNVGQL